MPPKKKTHRTSAPAGSGRKKTAKKSRPAENDPRVEPKAFAAETQAAPAAVGVAVPDTPMPKKPRLNGMLYAILGLLIVGVVVEVAVLMKGKAERQKNLLPIGHLGTRGGPPNEPGKFWGQWVVRADGHGRVFVVDHAFNKVLVWNTKDGRHVLDIDSQTAGRETFSPRNLDVDAEGNLYVLDKPYAEVMCFSPELVLQNRFPVSQPGEIAVGPNGEIYVTDAADKSVVQYAKDGQEKGRFGKGKFTDPRFLVTDQQGRIYVMDVASRQVLVFSPEGQFSHSIAVKFQLPVEYAALRVTQDTLYVSQLRLNTIWAFTLAGRLKWEINHKAIEPFDIDDAGVWYMTGTQGVQEFRIGE